MLSSEITQGSWTRCTYVSHFKIPLRIYAARESKQQKWGNNGWDWGFAFCKSSFYAGANRLVLNSLLQHELVKALKRLRWGCSSVLNATISNRLSLCCFLCCGVFWVLAFSRDAIRHVWLKMFSSLQPWQKHVSWTCWMSWNDCCCSARELQIREHFGGFICWLWFLMRLTVVCYSRSWSKQPAGLIHQVPVTKILFLSSGLGRGNEHKGASVCTAECRNGLRFLLGVIF